MKTKVTDSGSLDGLPNLAEIKRLQTGIEQGTDSFFNGVV